MNKQTAQLLEQHFDTAFAAPDLPAGKAGGIKKLRELILTLAMQGKLVEQNPNDPPASELLKEIEAEKQQLIKEKKIKKPKVLPPIKPEEIPYELPQSWEWVRLGEISEITGGFAFKSSKYVNDGVRVIRISDFDEKGFKSEKVVRYPDSDDLDGFRLETNNILMAMTGGTVGKSLLVKFIEEPMVVNQRVATIKMSAVVVPEFINGLIRTNLIQSVIHNAKNSTNDNISMGDITGFFVPLPPLPEQHRIVARIDQLMARCDELEKLRKEREEKRLAVHAAAIKQLLDAPNGSAWEFIEQHFGALYTVKENVAELRKAILQLAVMGRLVPQDPNDPPAAELLQQIDAEKQCLIKEKKIKKPNPIPPIKPEEIPYELPQGWEWVRLGDAMIKITDGTHHSPPNHETGDFLYISAKNIKDDGVLLSNVTYVTEDVHSEIFSRCDPEYGNVLYIKDGATTGIVTINNLKEPFSMLSSVALLKQPLQVNNHYLLFTLRSPFFYAEMRAGMTGVAITRVTLKKLNEAIVPLPPLPEQHRIVARIDQLMALCDTLDQQIDAATHKQTELLNAVMAQV